MNTSVSSMQQAIFQRLQTAASFSKIARQHGLSETRLKVTFQDWALNHSDGQPEKASDISVSTKPVGRPTTLTCEDEDLILQVARYYIHSAAPLTRDDIRNMVQDYVAMLPDARREHVRFKNGRPSAGWVTLLLRRHSEFTMRCPQQMEDKRVSALTKDHVATHIARLNSMMGRYGIRHARQVLNLDETGISFKSTGRRARKKAVGLKKKTLFQCVTSTRNIDHVTVMSVVSADGRTFKHAVVYPGVQAHIRRVGDVVESLNEHLMPCYLYQRPIAGVDSTIFNDWSERFVTEIDTYRQGGENLLLIYDAYSCHVQYRVLKRLRENNVFVVSLPAHCSHVLQPLDVSVFGSLKSHLRDGFNTVSRTVRQLHAFIIARVITDAYTRSHNSANIRGRFIRTGTWDWSLCRETSVPLERLSFFGEDSVSNDVSPTLESLVSRFERRGRDLILDADIATVDTVRVDTSAGGHLTSRAVLDALNVAEQRKKEADAAAARRAAKVAERRDDASRMALLEPMRASLRRTLASSRMARRRQAMENAFKWRGPSPDVTVEVPFKRRR